MIQVLKTRGTVKDGARVDSIRGGTWIGSCTILSSAYEKSNVCIELFDREEFEVWGMKG